MTWTVEYTDEFGHWWNGLTEAEQEDVAAAVTLLETRGAQLPYPYSSGSRVRGMHTCGSCESSIGDVRTAYFMHSIREGSRSC
jgi:hypothetical protein